MLELDQQVFLYVEDDPLSREIMAMLLQNLLGIQSLIIWEDSQDFEQKLLALQPIPTVILLDIHIRPLDGFQMLQLLRQVPSFQQVTTIALTASVMNEEVKQLRQSGFDGAIGKPINAQTFPALITRILQGESVWHIAD